MTIPPFLPAFGLVPPRPRLDLCRCGEPLELECERDEALCVNCQAERAGCSNGVLYPEVAA
mgnify:CR=1 FL=1